MTQPDRNLPHPRPNNRMPRRTMHDLRSSWREQASPGDLGELLLGVGSNEMGDAGGAGGTGGLIGDARSGAGGFSNGWGFRWGPGWLAASGAAAAVVALGMGLRFAVVPELPPAPPGQSSGVAGVGSGSAGVSAERLPTPPALPTVRALAVRPAGLTDTLTPMRPITLSPVLARPAAAPSASMIKLPPRVADRPAGSGLDSQPGAGADRPATWLAWFVRRPV